MKLKFYIHHYYSKSLFYKIGHNTKNRKYNLENNTGTIFCDYNGVELEFCFDPKINDNDDGFHVIDFLTILSQLNNDEKYENLNCLNRRKNTTAHRGIWGAEFGINDIPIMKWIADSLEQKNNWIILMLRTEKSFIRYDGIVYPPINDLEVQIDRLKNHKIFSDTIFIDDIIEEKYPNHFFVLTNTIHQWNELLSIRWYYEFKNIFEKLNQPYDICFSMRYHKRHRIDLIEELSKLNNPRIFLSRVDNCSNNEFELYKHKVSKINNINFNITNGDNFDDLTWIENIEHYLDYLMRILPMAKIHIVSETWDWVNTELTSNYLSEKTYGLILANVPFISLHTYPMKYLSKILEVENHPFYEEIKRIKCNPQKFTEFIKIFLEDFDNNYSLCKLWTNKCHQNLMRKINNENSLLDQVINNFEKVKITTNKKII